MASKQNSVQPWSLSGSDVPLPHAYYEDGQSSSGIRQRRMRLSWTAKSFVLPAFIRRIPSRGQSDGDKRRCSGPSPGG